MFFKKEEKEADAFWQEFEEKTGEKILSRGLGKYISGWEEFDKRGWDGIWGLLINTSGGFRFHHFPQSSWIMALTSFTGKNKPTEKTLFLPKERIISTELLKEKKWWKMIFSSSPPLFIIHYTDETGAEKQMAFEAEFPPVTV